jgi:integrase
MAAPKKSSNRRRIRGEGSVGWWEPRQCYRATRYLPNAKRQSFYGKTQKIALQKLKDAQSRADFDAGNITVAAYLERWLNSVNTSKAPSTARRYEQVVRIQIIPRLGQARLKTLTALHIQTLYDDLATKTTLSPGSRHKVAEVIINALNQAIRWKLIPHNPAAQVPRPRYQPKERASLTTDQVRALLQAAKGYTLEAFFVLALHSGLREGEMLALHWPDIDFEKATVRVDRSLTQLKGGIFQLKEPKRPRSRRTVPLSADAINALNEHRKRMFAKGQDVQTGPVFTTRTNRYIDHNNLLRAVFKPMLAKAGLADITIHDLRHTHASHLLRNGVPLHEVSRRLGHSRETVTLDTYAHLLPSASQELQSKLQTLFQPNSGTSAVQPPAQSS